MFNKVNWTSLWLKQSWKSHELWEQSWNLKDMWVNWKSHELQEQSWNLKDMWVSWKSHELQEQSWNLNVTSQFEVMWAMRANLNFHKDKSKTPKNVCVRQLPHFPYGAVGHTTAVSLIHCQPPPHFLLNLLIFQKTDCTTLKKLIMPMNNHIENYMIFYSNRTGEKSIRAF